MSLKLSKPTSNKLIKWFEEEKREMPWRRNRTPYRVWISELMLQQTRVNQAIPYYQNWMRKFPSLKSLSNASQEDILKSWEGLGYYSRARNIYKSVQIIKSKHNGRFPRRPEEIELLPGIGSYTKAAICSLALNLDYGVLDGNVIRVLSRFFSYQKDITSSSSKKELQSIIDASLPKGRAASFNEAIMELGAMICTPTSPNCNRCPIHNNCDANSKNTVLEYPIKKLKRKLPHIIVGAAVIIDSKNRILVSQRNENKMLGGLWEFPGGKIEQGETIHDCIIREIKEELDLNIKIQDFILCVNHSYSHFTMEMHAYFTKIISGRPKSMNDQKFKWLYLNELRSLPYPNADLKVIEALEKAM